MPRTGDRDKAYEHFVETQSSWWAYCHDYLGNDIVTDRALVVDEMLATNTYW